MLGDSSPVFCLQHSTVGLRADFWKCPLTNRWSQRVNLSCCSCCQLSLFGSLLLPARVQEKRDSEAPRCCCGMLWTQIGFQHHEQT